MKNRQRGKFDSYDHIKKYNIDHADVLCTLPIFAPDVLSDYDQEKAIFDKAYQSISEALDIQLGFTNVTGSQALEVKSAMASCIIKYAAIARIKAERKENITLSAVLDRSYTYIFAAPKQKAIKYAEGLLHAMKENRYDALTNPDGILNNISADNITEMAEAIQEYQKIQVKPIVAIQTIKAVSTDRLPLYIATADKAIKNMYDILFSHFSNSKSRLVELFAAAMHVTVTGTHFTGIAANITALAPGAETVSPIAGIKMYITELDKSAVSTISGVVSLKSIKAGTYNAVFSGEGVLTKIISVNVISGKTTNLNVELHHV